MEAASPDTAMARLSREYPLLWQELGETLSRLTPEEGAELTRLYEGLDCHDLPSVTVEAMLGYVRASRRARQELPYAAAVPEALYLDYVLPPRVNNEWLDGSRGWLLEILLPRVREKDILSAALEVNYWCAEAASYLPTDDRTIAPAGMYRRAQGRCGEESTLLVCALRAVGIPARQCYAPFWAHCDDNHAWVEFWAGDGWHYMGACEPEPQPDLGWFQSAASKAPLIRSRVPAPSREEGYRVVNTTANYGDTAVLTVLVTDGGQPVPGALVSFRLVNYSRLQTLHTSRTDETGRAAMEAGLGSLIVSTCLDGVLVERLIDLREERSVILRREDGFAPAETEQGCRWRLIPPREKIPAPPQEDTAHRRRERQGEALRRERMAGFYQGPDPWLTKARGNREEIQRFLSLPQYSREDKELLLRTLSEKDFCDCSCATLESYLEAALPYKDRHPPEIWQPQILAPRVEWEMLLPVRPALKALLRGAGLTSRQQVLDWMEGNLKKVAEFGLTDRRGNAAGYVRHGRCPESEWDILAVQICRSLGIPAALSPVTGKLKAGTEERLCRLTLVTEEPLNEEEHFSLSRWNGLDYVPIRLGRGLSGADSIALEPGAYSLITTRRQIDGSVDANARRFLLRKSRSLRLSREKEDIASRLISVPLPRFAMTALTENAPEVAGLTEGMPSLLVFLEPGKEPTEHLLQELLALARQPENRGFPFRFLLSREEALQNPTLRQILLAYPRSAAFLCEAAHRFPVQSAAGIGDSRLPLALALDKNQRITWGCANYNIRSAVTLLDILKLLDDRAEPRM